MNQNHPDADAEGYVHYPDINIVTRDGRYDHVAANEDLKLILRLISTAKKLARFSLDI